MCPGVAERDGDAGHGFKRPARNRAATSCCTAFFGVGDGVKRFDRRLMFFARAFFGNEGGVLFLNVRRIHEHDAAQVARGGGAMDRAVVTLFARGSAACPRDPGARGSRRRRPPAAGRTAKLHCAGSDSWRWPWNKPHSSNSLLPLTSMRYMEPVVVRAAPKKWIFMRANLTTDWHG